ncbi:MAG: threonine--tRNA ligase [Actinobacteria bacterium]|jgi:threonyl-tRNA synthetase|nr:threonine--tRNA ligase [Actinomycetota bacterium]
MKVTLPDGSDLTVADGATAADVAAGIGPRLAKAAVAAKIGDRVVDLTTPVGEGDQVAIITAASAEGLDVIRHSAAHVLADAATRLYPGTKVAIGPAIRDGFYYDFEFPEPVGEDDLPRFAEEIHRLQDANLPFERREVSKEEALELFADEPYKVELIKDLPEDALITVYRQGEFLDLCRGPHVPHTGRIGAVGLLTVAGAYWRGDSDNTMLTRIYGTVFPTQKELMEYLERVEMARQRDHRRLGRELGLFSFHDEGPGFPFFHPKGMRVINALLEYWRKEHAAAGYEEIRTPIILERTLWEHSGHWDNYKDNMYFTKIDDVDFAVKPMNCPGGTLVYKSEQHSYRDLPLRLAELGQVHRHELSGVLHGLFRVRCFTQDDAHIFCLPEQVEEEVVGVIDLILRMYRTFGFDRVHLELSTRPEKSMGTDEMWNTAESALAGALDRAGLNYTLNPGDGAFYGPKIDFHIEDVMGRTWQCATCQLDFTMPERLDLEYVGEDNQKHRPVMLHRVVYGSLERFLGILIEHYGGAFPAWLAPVQVAVVPVADRHAKYGDEVGTALKKAGLRVEVDLRSESVSKKIRDGEVTKVPFMLVVGDREIEQGSVTLRVRGSKDIRPLELSAAVAEISEHCRVPEVRS